MVNSITQVCVLCGFRTGWEQKPHMVQQPGRYDAQILVSDLSQVYNDQEMWLICSMGDFFRLPCRDTDQMLYLKYVNPDKNMRVGFAIYVEGIQCGLHVFSVATLESWDSSDKFRPGNDGHVKVRCQQRDLNQAGFEHSRLTFCEFHKKRTCTWSHNLCFLSLQWTKKRTSWSQHVAYQSVAFLVLPELHGTEQSPRRRPVPSGLSAQTHQQWGQDHQQQQPKSLQKKKAALWASLKTCQSVSGQLVGQRNEFWFSISSLMKLNCLFSFFRVHCPPGSSSRLHHHDDCGHPRVLPTLLVGISSQIFISRTVTNWGKEFSWFKLWH